MASNPIQAIRDKAHKLNLLADLLSDPEIAFIARNILLSVTASESEAPTTEEDDLGERVPKPRRGRKRGALAIAALDIVNNAAEPVNAKNVADALEASGFDFGGLKAPQVAVSKALRSLASERKIHGEKVGHSEKAAIFYCPSGRDTGSAQQSISLN